MKQQIIATTHPVDDEGRPLVSEEKPKTREQITLPPAHVEPYDPWAGAIDPQVLTEAGRGAVPEHDLAPWGWFKLREATRAHLGGLAVLLLHEHPARPDEGNPGVQTKYQRLGHVYTLVELALRGAYVPRADFELNQLAPAQVAAAARFYVEQPSERMAAQQHHEDLLGLGFAHIELVKDLLRKLDGSRGIVADLRALRTKLDAQLARLEKRLGGGA